MQLGRCVKVDFGFIGCKTNVLHILDRKCSGKLECEVRIPDPELDATKPCIGDLTRYLSAEYLCVPGVFLMHELNITLKAGENMGRGVRGKKREGMGKWKVEVEAVYTCIDVLRQGLSTLTS